MDPTIHANIIKLIIGYTLLGAFIFTVVATCLSLVGIVKFAHVSQQRKLFAVLLVELIVICLGVFSQFLSFNTQSAADSIDTYARLELSKGAEAIASAPTVSITSAPQYSILWVDDNPDNNAQERKIFDSLGIAVTAVQSTEEAIRELQNRPFGLIISDMKRGESVTAGYDLLEKVRRTPYPNTPLVFYTGSSLPEFANEARARGAIGLTDRPSELLTLAMATLSKETPRDD